MKYMYFIHFHWQWNWTEKSILMNIFWAFLGHFDCTLVVRARKSWQASRPTHPFVYPTSHPPIWPSIHPPSYYFQAFMICQSSLSLLGHGKSSSEMLFAETFMYLSNSVPKTRFQRNHLCWKISYFADGEHDRLLCGAPQSVFTGSRGID